MGAEPHVESAASWAYAIARASRLQNRRQKWQRWLDNHEEDMDLHFSSYSSNESDSSIDFDSEAACEHTIPTSPAIGIATFSWAGKVDQRRCLAPRRAVRV